MKTPKQPLEWFMDRIGKRVYRNDTDCDCKTCREVGEVGLEIRDKEHAQYLYNTQIDYLQCGINLNYRDNP